jgi:hypothetical protein
MHAHAIEGLILGGVLICGFIISQVIQYRRRRNSR